MSNKLTYNGKEYRWKDGQESEDKLMSASGFIGDSLPAVELGVDTLRAVVRDYDTQPRILTADGLPLVCGGRLLAAQRTGVGLDKAYRYGADVLYHHNDKLVGKFKLEEIKRTGRYQYALSCVSAIGLLLTSDHYGGIYTGQSVSEIIADIIGGIVPYTLDATLGAVPVYGLLRKAKRRDNLRDVLFAVGGQIRKNTAGEINIIPMTAGTPYEITADEFYMGGSVTGGKPATGVNVTEHSFMALDSDDIVTLFDGAAAGEELVTPKAKTVTGVLVDFQEPVHDLVIQNSVILESGANYAVIANSPAAVLTGKQYTHTTRIVSRRWDTGGAPNIVNSSTCELVSLMNAELVADRLKAYYGSAKTVEAEIVVDGHKPGDTVTFTDPFGDPTTAYIADMELVMSAILKAKATLVSGYIPPASGNYYSNVMVIRTSQTVTIPAEAKEKGLCVLIGGGHGGGLGNPGEAGTSGSSSSPGNGGAGGLPGVPGAGGKISIGTIPLKAGQTFSVVIGKGGKGQSLTTAAGKGGATTFGPYSSEDGFSSPDGYVNLLTGDVYGTPGVEGIPGGKGAGADGEGESVLYNCVTYVPGARGEDETYSGYTGFGGFGGGPAAGANGGNGGAGSVDYNNGNPFADGGVGGKGATPVKAQAGIVPGQGGQAGHGSGGGGGGGAAKGSGSSYQWPGSGGDPGDPGEGGDGADGIALLYY